MSQDSRVEEALMLYAMDFLTNEVSPSYSNAKDITRENVKSSASQSPEWSSIYYRPNTPSVFTLGQNGIDIITGFIQIDFNIPTDAGVGRLREWEDKARSFFVNGNTINYDGQSVIVKDVGMGQGRLVENNFRKSLTVGFKAHLKRQNTTINYE